MKITRDGVEAEPGDVPEQGADVLVVMPERPGGGSGMPGPIRERNYPLLQ